MFYRLEQEEQQRAEDEALERAERPRHQMTNL